MKSWIIFLLSTAAFGVAENETICKLGSLKRSVTIEYTKQPEKAPCQVSYYKQTEEPWKKDILWESSWNPGFCSKNAEGLIETLQSHGWKCSNEKASNNTASNSR